MNRSAPSPGPLELWTRACAFHLGLVLSTLLFAPVALFCIPFPYRFRYALVSQWAIFNLWWLAKTCRLTHHIEGLENVPATPTIVLCKHQSTWETLTLNLIFRPQVWVIKRELLRIPLFGWGLATLRPIAIDREAGASAASQVITQGRERLENACWVVVFPEGTRTAPGSSGRYRIGGARLAHGTGCPVVPVAHNAGDYWPRKSFIKHPGTIRMVIGPLIQSVGRSAVEINQFAEAWIEATVARLREEDGHLTTARDVAPASAHDRN